MACIKIRLILLYDKLNKKTEVHRDYLKGRIGGSSISYRDQQWLLQRG